VLIHQLREFTWDALHTVAVVVVVAEEAVVVVVMVVAVMEVVVTAVVAEKDHHLLIVEIVDHQEGLTDHVQDHTPHVDTADIEMVWHIIRCKIDGISNAIL